jgi:predicted ArsR family transcriptional regulator
MVDRLEGDRALGAVAALADPVRRSLYNFVASQPAAVRRDEAARGAGVADHVAKFHLERLVDEGLLEVDYRRPPGRGGPGAGRPAKLYRRARREVEVTVPERRYEFAGRVLAEAVTRCQRDETPVAAALDAAAADAGTELGEEVRRRAGRRIGAAHLRDATLAVLASEGYEPRLESGGVSLVNCPFHRLAEDYTDLVCGMNQRLLAALLDSADPDGRTHLCAVLDPAPERCCVRLVPAGTA